MTNEEKYLRQHLDTQNHFRVPDGYFDNFATQLMAKLPEARQQEQPLRAVKSRTAKPSLVVSLLRPVLFAAACLFVGVLSITIYLNHGTDETDPALAAAQEGVMNDAYFEEAASYAMLDNSDIYAYLANE